MPKSNVVVMGASAGGVEALQEVASGLPRDLKATIFAVLHIGEGINGRSELPQILERAGPLPARNPKSGESTRQGTIYVAPPDCHMILSHGGVHLSHGPKENRTRPAINPLFRSAANVYRGSVAGVVLTGMLDDGTAGLAQIKRCGGIAIAQDPFTASYPGMPTNAIRHVQVDHVVPLGRIAGLISELAETERSTMEKQEPLQRELVDFTCPECRGPIWQEIQGNIVEYRCLVGHAYSPLAMAAEHQQAVERTLWSSVVALEEAAGIDERLAADLGPRAVEEAERKRKSAATIRDILNQGSKLS